MAIIKSSTDHLTLNADGASKDIKFQANGVEKAVIDSAGNVGIGTSSPSEKLDTPNIVIGGSTISGSYRANSILMDNNAGTARVYSTGPDATTKGSYTFNNASSDGSLNSEAMRIDSSGNVGIGTSSPTTELQTLGTITSHNSNTEFVSIRGLSGGQYIEISESNDLVINKIATFPHSGATELVRFKTSGGITFNGDTAAANALDDYEEGTWTPANTYIAITNEVTARYVKIGNMVTVWGNITWASSPADVSQTGGKIQGLPYTPLGGDHPWVASWWQNTSTGSIRVDSGNTNYDFMVNASTELVIYNRPSSRVAQRQQVSGTHMKFQATYQVA